MTASRNGPTHTYAKRQINWHLVPASISTLANGNPKAVHEWLLPLGTTHRMDLPPPAHPLSPQIHSQQIGYLKTHLQQALPGAFLDKHLQVAQLSIKERQPSPTFIKHSDIPVQIPSFWQAQST